MGQPKLLQEQPSMDDILSSIRRIIERGESGTGEAAVRAAPPAAPLVRAVPAPNEARIPAAPAPAVRTVTQAAPVATAMSTAEQETARTLADILPPLSNDDLDAFAAALDARSEAFAQPESVQARPAAGSMQTPPRNRYETRFTEDDSRAFAAVGKALAQNGDVSQATVRAQAAPAAAATVAPASVTMTPLRAVNDDPRPAPLPQHDFKPTDLNPRATMHRDPQQRQQGAAPAAPLVSQNARQSVGLSFDALSRALDEHAGRGLETLAEDLLKPMLSEWLDNNLPTIVERLVRQEIERIARGEGRVG